MDKRLVVLLLFGVIITSCSFDRFPAEPPLPAEDSFHTFEDGLSYFNSSTGSSFLSSAFTADSTLNIPLSDTRFVYKYYYVYHDGKWEKKAFSGASESDTGWILVGKDTLITEGIPNDPTVYVAVYSCSSRSCSGEGWRVHQFVLSSPESAPTIVSGTSLKKMPSEKTKALRSELPKLKPVPAGVASAPTGRPRPSGGGSGGGNSPAASDCSVDSDCSLFYTCSSGHCMPLNLGAGPGVFNTKFYQSPVRADPGDLLLISGDGFREGVIVIYKQVSDNPGTQTAPTAIPSANTFSEGELFVGTVTNNSIAVLLPTAMLANKTYTLWVKNTNSNWSEEILINDPRPLWISPSVAYQTQEYASLPRTLKVIGRNMQGSGVAAPKIRLNGNTTYNITVSSDSDSSTEIEHYVAKGPLPSSMQADVYLVQYSRDDGATWIDLPEGINLTVLTDPEAKTIFNITEYGGCAPDDNIDDTNCTKFAIANASSAGGEVFFPAGAWNLTPTPTQNLLTNTYGLVIPRGVDLVGAGRGLTTVVIAREWNISASINNTQFDLGGNNIIRNINFVMQDFSEPTQSTPFFIGLGKAPGANTSADYQEIHNVSIYNNNFTGMYYAIGTYGFPSRKLFITNNVFSAYVALEFTGDRRQHQLKYGVRDSVIVNNTFYPINPAVLSTSLDTIATGIAGAQRVDFSNNIANGSINGGLRAGFFFSTLGRNERLLISKNTVTCTVKRGDGEAIIFDQNQNQAGFYTPQNVTSAAFNTINVTGNWLIEADDFYLGHNVLVVDGKGLGQVRVIVNYTNTTYPLITVSPDWDVIPDNSSVIVVERANWNAYVVDNVVDIRGCPKINNLNPPQAGLIGWAATTSDSTIAGNKLYETGGGIYVSMTAQINSTWVLYASEIRNNLVDGEYLYPYTLGGILLLHGTDAAFPSPVLGHNVLISYNTINGSDTAESGQSASSLRGGIGFISGTHSSTPYEVKSILVSHNIMENTTRGIYIVDNYTWHTVLYNNTFINLESSKRIVNHGTNSSFCGNNKVELNEVCDNGYSEECDYGLTFCQTCSAQCTGLIAGNATYCGNNACDIRYESSYNCSQDCGAACPTDRLLDWWKGNNDAQDATDNRDGTINGSVTFVNATVGQAFNFSNASSNYLATDQSSTYNFTNGLTFMAWVNPLSSSEGTILGVAHGNNLGYQWSFSGGTTLLFAGGTTQGQNGFQFVNHPSVPTNKWTHLAVTWNATAGFKAYMNGTLVDSGATTINHVQWGSASNTGFAIGLTRTNGATGHFNGSIDEIVIWDRALNSTEILAIYNAGNSGMCNP